MEKRGVRGHRRLYAATADGIALRTCGVRLYPRRRVSSIGADSEDVRDRPEPPRFPASEEVSELIDFSALGVVETPVRVDFGPRESIPCPRAPGARTVPIPAPAVEPIAIGPTVIAAVIAFGAGVGTWWLAPAPARPPSPSSTPITVAHASPVIAAIEAPDAEPAAARPPSKPAAAPVVERAKPRPKRRARRRARRQSPPQVPPSRPPPLSRSLRRDEITDVVKGSLSRIRRCGDGLDGPHGTVLIDFEIHADGRVAGAAPRSPSFQATARGKCVVEAVGRLRFPAFTGPPLRIAMPFTL